MKPGLGWVWFLVVVVVLVAGIAGVDADTMGLILIGVALLPALASRQLAADSRLRWIFVLVVLAHGAVAVVNAMVTTTVGADQDAIGFHTNASAFAAAHAIDPAITPRTIHLYSELLGYAYRYLGTSLLLGNAFSVLAVALAMLVLVLILREVGVEQRASTLALFGLLPSGLMLMSVTLREAYQQLLLLLVVLTSLRLRSRGWHWILPLGATATALATLHVGLPLFAGFVVMSALTWSAAGRGLGRHAGRRLAAIALSLVLVALAARSAGSLALDAVANGQAFEFADTYRKNGEAIEARTTYGLRLDTSSTLGLAVTVPVVFVEYMLAPFPWQAENLLDVEGMGESALRLVLVVASLVAWRRARGMQRSQLALLIWLYLGLELLWSLGTVNWGTAIRHHLPGFGLLAVTGGPLVLRALSDGVARLVRAPRTA